MKANRPLLLILLLFPFAGFSQNSKVHLASGSFTPTANLQQPVIDSLNAKAFRQNNRSFLLLQFNSIPNAAARQGLSRAGIELLEYIPENTYTASVNGQLGLHLLQAAGVRSIFELAPVQKMERRLQGTVPFWAVKVPGTVDVWISFPKTFSVTEVTEGIKGLQADVISTIFASQRILHLRVGLMQLSELASQPFVEFVQLAPRGDQTLNFNSRAGSRTNMLNASIADGGKGLNGEGVVVGVGDNADVQTHIDFSGRLINRSSMSTAAGHGHHVTGTVGGSGLGNDFFRGYAPKSTILSQGYNGLIVNANAYVNDYRMVVTNNSYGDNIECDYYGTYDLYSRWLDQMAFDLPYLQNVFSAGNSGASTCGPFLPFYHTVLGGYQSAKNVLTVGATTDSGMIAGFSSRGPVRDGRTKPEITAMGQQVASAWASNLYSYNNGTSMSGPAVAGGMVLLYQRYRQLNGGADPKNALMKAVMCNGAMDRGNTGPDFQYGYGWMNLLRSVEMIEKNWYVSSTVNNGATNNHNITIPASTSQLKVMLYWNDPAASPLSAKTLVNDLDLEVIGTTTTLPRILDSANANLNTPSVEGADHRNNMEQVIVNNPSAGNFTLRVKGTAVTQGLPQEYFVVYDLIPANQIRITSPAGGETWIPSFGASSQMKISWDAYGFSSGTVNIEFSPDNGSNWSTLGTNIDINRVVYSWYVPNVSTTEALIRITKTVTGETATSNQFTIMPLPVVTLAAVQCEGYISISWGAVAGATDYEVMMLRGDDMQPVAATNLLNYTFSGLSKDSLYWFTVRPRMNGKPGRRAWAVSRQPNSGSCSGNISDNDLKLDAILGPVSGRRFTSTQLTSTSQISIRIKNLDDAPISGFDLKYSINGSPFITETPAVTIAPGASYTHVFSPLIDLSPVGNYNLTVVVKAAADPVAINDTARTLVKHLDNQPLNLATYFVDDIESAADVVYEKDTLGLNGLPRYDFSRNTGFGRLRTFLNSGMAYSGSKALILDINRQSTAGNTNQLTGTFNLAGYNAAANDLRMDFQYNNHGQQPHTTNRVWIRGNDAQSWIEVYNLSSNQNDPGLYKKTESIELSDVLSAAAQTFGTSFQIRWGQWGQYPASDRTNAGGYSFDDIRLYQVFNDLQMKTVDEPAANSCALSSSSIIKVSVRNSANGILTNIPVKYRVNNGAWITETIPSIGANTTIQYSFTTPADLSMLGNHTIQALVDYNSDSFRENDTISTVIVNSPLISSFPHLQNFESGTASWYAGGKNKSWEFGTPASNKIRGAASGSRAWKTRLVGHYNDNELSYLYSPCYDISGLTNPTLSFSIALDLEDCNTVLCDGAWVEYSADGTTWTKLGTSGTGFNWYNKAGTQQLWSIQNYTAWHVATVPLPAGLNRLRLRIVLSSDVAVNREGVAIDDIHIYSNSNGIYDGLTMATPVSSVVSGDSWTHFTSGNKLVASIRANNQNLGSTAVQAYINTAAVRFTPTQYYHDRNITIKPSNPQLNDSVWVRFYFLDKEMDTLLKATGCSTCPRPRSAYEMGVSKYSDLNTNFENGSIGDNSTGMWTYIPSPAAPKVPFDKGYYAEFKVKDFSEFWLNHGGPNGNTPLPVKLMEFTAQKSGGDVLLKWSVGSETNVDRYELELARGNDALQTGTWVKIGEVASLGNTSSPRDYQFTDTESGKAGIRYYRLKTVNADGSFFYSPVRSVSFDQSVLWQVYPNPSSGVFSMVYHLNPGETLFARVMDAQGRLIKEYNRAGSGQIDKLVIDLTLQATGTYLLETATGGKKELVKLFKH